MKGRIVALDQINGRNAAALMVDGLLEDFLIDPADGDTPLPGTIMRAICERPLKGQGGMMLRLPGHSGFLRSAKGLRPGQPLLVQVSGYADEGKAIPVTDRVTLKGRSVIVTPHKPGINISRSIRDEEERLRLRDAVNLPEINDCGFGVILRTGAQEMAPEDIAAEALQLVELTAAILGDQDGTTPETLLDGPGAQELAWREWGDVDVLDRDKGAFSRHGFDDAIDALNHPQVALAGGGSVVVEPTRAFVAVDVNSGTDTSMAAGLKTNIAAARALPRILRCRGLGGQIIVDFAPMPKKDRHTLEQILKSAFRSDPVDTALAGWTNLGNFEMQRKRERLPKGRLPL